MKGSDIMKKKTHEEYVAELAIKNPTVEVIGKYVDAKTKITHHCLIHDIYWEISPSNALRGNGCEKCRRDKIKDYHQRTHEEYLLELKNINPYIEVLEEYIDSNTSILHRCIKHDIEWYVSPANILQGHGCEKCRRDKISNKLSKTHEQYILELKSSNPNIIPLEEYKGANIQILHKCLLDDYEWMATPANMLYSCGCPKCSQRFRRTHEDYVLEVSIVNPDIEVIGNFNGLLIPILHKCKIHNIEWMANPDSILRGHGCFECGNEKISIKNKKYHEQYIKDLKIKNPYVISIDTYIDCYTPILHKCLIHNIEWMVKPSNVLQGCGCPQCNESKGERLTRQWLETHDIKYISQYRFDDCKDINTLPFDFYLPEYNCCIEYDGEQHYRPVDIFGGEDGFKIRVKHDNIKNEYCKNNNIKLIRIPYFKNIEEELNNFLFI